jgi:exodeoxyribonuclease V alpha subunit
MAELLTLNGIIERVTFHNPDNGFAVIKVNVRGERDPVTVVGNAPSLHAGEYLSCSGHWINDQNYGRQFSTQHMRVMAPTTVEGIEKYLASGMIKGIGPVYAKKLVKAFGVDVFQVIEHEPHLLRRIEGIGEFRVARITEGWQQQKSVREIMLFLHQHGVTTSRAVRIYKTYGEQAISVIESNPYQLARDIRGIGFVSADRIALHMGVEKTSLKRLSAGIQHALLEATSDGHCGLPQEELIHKTAELLEVIPEVIPAAIQQALADGLVVADDLMLYLPHLYHYERFIAHKILSLQAGSMPWPAIDAAKAISWAESHSGISLASSQREVLQGALTSKVCIITGGPGVGKTTLMNCLLKILQHKVRNILLCAPTGRAAKRLSESTGLEAMTIHRLLQVDPASSGFKMNEEKPLETGLLVVDECSMLDVPLMASLLKALPETAGLILVGDVDQLPSVGPGQVLRDLIDSTCIPTFRLTEVFRQAATSRIIQNAQSRDYARFI